MDMNKIQKYLWIACVVLSVVCMGAAAWACYELDGDMTCGAMAVVFAAAAVWGFKRIK
ncbi:MAG: hypothetical protein MJZ83_00560 [Bacteroidaceae bacterium]|nr:hypothetical protein [Bacteroidaceae bacterium]